MELFTIGRGNYTERDVREAARAFTGWGAEVSGFVFRREYHDDGVKTVLGETGSFDGDDVVRVVTSRPECARFISRKLLAFFSHPEPTDAEVAAAAAVFAKTDGKISEVVRHIFLGPPADVTGTIEIDALGTTATLVLDLQYAQFDQYSPYQTVVAFTDVTYTATIPISSSTPTSSRAACSIRSTWSSSFLSSSGSSICASNRPS